MQLRPLNYTLISQSETEAEPSQFTAQRRSAQNRRRGFIWGLLSFIGLSTLVVLAVHQTRSRDDYDLGDAPPCPQYSPIVARSESRADFERELAAELSSDEFLEASLKRLQGAVRVPTESFDDMKPVGEDPRWDVFVD